MRDGGVEAVYSACVKPHACPNDGERVSRVAVDKDARPRAHATGIAAAWANDGRGAAPSGPRQGVLYTCCIRVVPVHALNHLHLLSPSLTAKPEALTFTSPFIMRPADGGLSSGRGRPGTSG